MVRQTPLFHVFVHVQLAPPSTLGAWSMALVAMVVLLNTLKKVMKKHWVTKPLAQFLRVCCKIRMWTLINLRDHPFS